ncbi:hypothetical protein B0H14DRAFT_2625672 [Mycena olivaceomarginata]|nr:hypothetical protein B0H14DRAFT_2625672 [Mycena olivaceomarginata]
MVNMWCLGIVPGIPLSRELMSTLPFRLTCFQAIGAVDGTWSDFVASQTGLSRLYFESDFLGQTPGPLELPNLVSVKGRPKDVARFAELHSLESLWVVPDVVSLLVHLVLDEDLTWSNFTLGSDHSLVKSTFAGVATALNGQFLHLRRLILVCAVSSYGHGERRPLRLADAKCFAKILASNSGVRGLRTFRLHTRDGCANWTDWGLATEAVSYSACGKSAEFRASMGRKGSAFSVWKGSAFEVAGNGRDPRSTLLSIPQWERMIPRLCQIRRDPTIIMGQVLPRPFVKPPPTPPQGRVRLRPSTQAADTKAETDTVAQPWSAAMTELFAEALNWKPSDEIDPSDGKDRGRATEDPATKKARLEEEEAGERSWERAVELCVGGMREPDRREWFRDQRIQEEYEARNAHPPSDADDSWRDVSVPGYID